MHKYRVVERWADESRVALQCHMGRYHVALALNGMPPAAGTLHGQSRIGASSFCFARCRARCFG